MSIPEFSVNRPVTTSMFFVGVLMLGLISLTRLPQELFPSITYPQLTIVTSYENAAPEEVETLITKIIEEAVGTVSNMKRISSVSKEGISIVTAEFNWGTSMDFASLGVREKIDLIKERLPLGSSDPIVMKFNPFELPVITFSVTGDRSPAELLRLSRKFIKDELEKIEGVASSNISGGLEREILVSVDAGRLQASGIPITKIVDALKASNLNYPAGTIEEHFYEYLIRTMGEFKIVPEIRETIVGKDDLEHRFGMAMKRQPKEERGTQESRLIFLKDIAKIKDTFQERTSISRYNGEENISIAVQKQAGVNTLRVAEKIREKLAKIKEELPRGMNVEIIYDQSIFIKQSIRGVMEAAIQGGFLAFIVLFIFLRNIKASIIVSFSMPISVMVAFSLMYFNGITLNMLSLGGLALGIGMLVDNAIVVIENIYNHFQKKKDMKESAKEGASEVSGAIFSSTLTTVAVFLPMIFVVGVAGQLFKELAFTVTFSLLASLIVALSLIPRLAAIKTGDQPNKLKQKEKKPGISKSGNLYTRFAKIVLRQRWLFLIGVIMLFLMSMSLVPFLDKEFMPKVDQREFIMKANMPSGIKLDVTDRVVKRIEKILLETEEIKGVAVSIGSSKKKDYAHGLETMGSYQSQIIVNLKKGDRWVPTSEVIERLKEKFKAVNLEGAEIEYILQESVFKSAMQGSAPIVIEVKGKDLKKIKEISEDMQVGLSKIRGIYGIRTSLAMPSPETKVNIIKDKAALYSLSASAISQAAHTAIKGVVASRFKEEGQEIDIRVRLRKEDRSGLSKLRNILIHSPLDIEVPLSEVAYIVQGVGPSEIKRLDQQRVVLVTANIADRALDKVVTDIEILKAKIEREYTSHALTEKDSGEKEFTVDISGESQQMAESFDSLRFALILSILLVYMIMAAQFESLWQPFIIMFTVPLSLIGVLAALFLTGTPVSVVVILGVIMLGGIVVNNGIILIDSINRLRQEGAELIEAVIESGRIRLRPIFMTTMTTVLGLLPLALGIAEGSEMQSPMAITVMGGLMVSTLLTLFVIPCIYIIVAGILERGPVLKIATAAALAPAKVAVTAPKIKPGPKTRPLILPSPKIELELPEPKAKPDIIEKPKEEKKKEKKEEEKEEKKVIELPEIKPEALPEPEVSKPEPSSEPEAETPKPEAPRFNKRQRKFLEYLKKVKTITRKEYAAHFKVSVPTAARDLKELTDRGLIIGHGPFGPGRWYELI